MDRGKARFLLVESDENLGQLLKGYFEAKNFEVDFFCTAEGAYDAMRMSRYDICLADLVFPDEDGFVFIQSIRQRQQNIPIIIVSARHAKDDVVRAFQLGVDDYVIKPFNIEELSLRIEALLRRCNVHRVVEDDRTTFQIGMFVFDVVRQVLQRDGEPEVRLTTKESDLLRQLVINANNVLTREQALKLVWAESSYFNARSMDVYITRLRKILSADPTIEILNVRGRGFKLVF